MELSCSSDKLGKYKSIVSVMAIDQCGHTTGVPSFKRHTLIRKYSPDNEVAVTIDDDEDRYSCCTCTGRALGPWFNPLALTAALALGDKKLFGDNPPAAFNFKVCLFLMILVDDFQYVSNLVVSSTVPENGKII